MFEKVNPNHPDKVADRIAGALVDYAYSQEENPRVAVEVLIGHGQCHIITESSVFFPMDFIKETVARIAGPGLEGVITNVPQDPHLAHNQEGGFHCGDNGIFRGFPTTQEQKELALIAGHIYDAFGTDGKYILHGKKLIICQSNASDEDLRSLDFLSGYDLVINPLGPWTGGPGVDTGATNRKLGSDMGDSVTGGGLHGKDLSKADVSVNILLHILAQSEGHQIGQFCAIGDKEIGGVPYAQVVEIARDYIKKVGGFEKFAEWGLIRP